MNIFQNAFTTVQKHSSGINKLNDVTKMSNGLAAKEILEKRAVLEHCEDIDRQAAQSEKNHQQQQQTKKVVSKQIFESQMLNRANQIYTEGRVIVFKDILFEAFKRSLYLDEEFVVEHLDALKALTDSYIDKNGGMKLLENAVRVTNSQLLKKIQTLCESTAKAVSQRKLKQAKEDTTTVDCLNFELNEDEKSDLDYEKSKIGIDELADLVKKKVLTVVQDEKSRQEKEEALYSDIENELQNDENVTDQKTLNEALRKIQIKKNPVEESTIFNSLLRHSLMENMAIRAEEERAQEKEREERIKEGEQNIADEVDQAAQDAMIDDEEFDVDMDMVLAEAVTKYTLMEVLHTTKLETYTFESLQNLSRKLLATKK